MGDKGSLSGTRDEEESVTWRAGEDTIRQREQKDTGLQHARGQQVRGGGTYSVPSQLSLTWKPVPATSLPHFLSILSLLYKYPWPWKGDLLALGVSLGLMAKCIFHSILQVWKSRRGWSMGEVKRGLCLGSLTSKHFFQTFRDSLPCKFF